MHKLSSTWKQQKQIRTRQETHNYLKETFVTDLHQTIKDPIKRLGQHAVSISASGVKLIGRSNQLLVCTASRDDDEAKQGKGISQSGLKMNVRRSPRLKGHESDQETLTHGEETHHGSFNSSFSGDLDDDVLQAMEEVEANYCHQNQQTETSRGTGALLQHVPAIDVTGTARKGNQMETGEDNGRSQLHVVSACSLDHKPDNGMESDSNTGVPHREFQNSEDLFTEIRPKNVGEGIKLVPTNYLDISNKLYQIPSAKMNYSLIDIQLEPEQQCDELKMLTGSKQPSNNKRVHSSAILNELTQNNENTKLGRKFIDCLTDAEKENSPAGQVLCMDSQSQTESSDAKQIEQKGVYQKQFLDQRNKLMFRDQNRMIQKRGSQRSQGRNPKRVPAKIETNGSIRAKSTAEQVLTQQKSEASHHSAFSPPTSTDSPLQPMADPLLLSSWGLPEQVLVQYHRCHVTHMFPWQAQCLALGRVLDGGNLVYSAPTSAGKTLVAELLILKRVLETKKKALLILPFVSVAREKMFYLQGMFQDAGVRVGGYMGSESPTGGFQTVDVAVCTIEKANSLVNRLLEESKVDQLGIIVVDELHMVGDAHRGYLLELLLTKVRYISKKTQDAATTDNTENPAMPIPENSIQIIGMSATLPNLDHLAKWLDADLYHTDFRPVPLTQTLKVGGTIYDSALTKLRDFKPPRSIPGDEDQILSLCLETLSIGCSVLIFCPTKNWCEKLCENMAREIFKLTGMIPSRSKDEEVSINLNKQSLQDVLEQLKRIPVGLDPVLGRTVPCGVAYHHAGLSFDERDIIEGAFRQSAIKILVATSTLSSGVNLPARRVIIRSVMFNRRVLDPLLYRQMSGRAGRKGVDTEGESILICKPSERDKAAKMMQAPLPPVQSCLKKQGQDLSNSMKRAILEVIASGAASTPDEVSRYASCTLLAAGLMAGPTDQGSTTTEGGDSTSSAIDKCVQFLQRQEFILLQKAPGGGESVEAFRPTQLGSATLASALSPDEALVVFSELQRARKNFVLENDLHLLYQVTPIYDQGFQPNWYEFMCTWENLSTDKRRVAELVGVEERFLIRAAQGALSTHNAKLQHALAVHKRFYTTLILNDLVREMPVVAAARKYGCARGQLQSLQQSAATFAGMVTAFCSKLGWTNLELLLAQYQSRLTFGVQRELCDLVRISLLNAFRARLLYNSGFASVAAVAAAKPSDVECVLRKAVPFQSSRKAIDEQQFEVDERKQSRCIWATGRKSLTEQQAALMIVQEAKDLLKADLGALGVEWKPTKEPRSSRSGDDTNDSGRSMRTSPSRIQPPNTNCEESSSRSGDGAENCRKMTRIQTLNTNCEELSSLRSGINGNERTKKASPSRIQLPNTNYEEPPSLRSEDYTESQRKPRASLPRIQPPSTNCETSYQHAALVANNLNQKNESTSGSLPKHQKTERQQFDGGCELTSGVSDALRGLVTRPVVKVSDVCTRAKGRGRILTIEADVHIDASSSGRAAVRNFNPTRNLQTSSEITSHKRELPIQPSAKKSASIPDQLDCDPVIPIGSQSSNQLIASAIEVSKTQLAANLVKNSTSNEITKENKHLTTPTAANHQIPPIVQQTSPDLFSLPVSPFEEMVAAATDSGTDAPVNNKHLSPINLGPTFPAFSPLDSQMLEFLELQEQAHCLGKSTTLGKNDLPLDNQVSTSDKQILKKTSPVSVTRRCLGQDSQASPVFSLDPKVLKLVDGFQDADSKTDQQMLPVQEKDLTLVSSSHQTQQSSPSYSPLDSQALLFSDSTSTIELHPSQSQQSVAAAPVDDLQFTSSFPTLDSQVLKLIDGFHTTRNELAAETASPALKSHNKPQTSKGRNNKRSSLRSTRRNTALKGRSGSQKKQKLVLTFCQSESPYSEFFQDEEITLNLAETLECSFVIDQSKRATQQPSINYQAGNTNTSSLGPISSRKKSSSTLNTGGSANTNLDKVEPFVYSQLEADLALAAEWSDSFSFDEGQQVAVNSPPESNLVQDVQVDNSNAVENHETIYERGKDKPKSINCRSHTKAVPVIRSRSEIDLCNGETPQKTLRSATKVVTCSKTGKNTESKTVRYGEVSVQDSANQHFNDELSPGTIAMLDLFAGDSFSRISSPAVNTSSVNHTTYTSGSQNARNKASTRSVVANPTSANNSDGKPLHQNTCIADQSRSTDLVSKSNCKKTKHPKREQRKRRSCEGISNLVQEDIPTKKPCQEPIQERRPYVNSGGDNETPDTRRKSDSDFISPTPPKEKLNTPKLLKGTPNQRPVGDISREADTPRSLRLRERSTAQHKQATKTHKVVRSLDNKSTPSSRNRTSPRSNLPVNMKLIASPLNTPELDSSVQSQEDLNAAQGESQLYLHFDSESSFEIESPTPPRGKPAPANPPRTSPRCSSARDGLPVAPIQQTSPKVSSTQGAFTIIDVCSSKELFQTFLKEWSSKSRYSLSVACERYQPPVQGGGIGGNIRKAVLRPNKPDSVDGFQVGDDSLVAIGLSICWEDKDAYFISFQRGIGDADPDDSLAQPPVDPNLPIHKCLQAVKTNLEMDTIGTGNRTKDVSKLAFDCKEHYKVLSRGCGISLEGGLVDPKVAHWLIDPGAKERNLHGLVTHYIPQEGHILDGISGGIGLGSLGLIAQDPGTGRLRAATESVLVLALMDHLEPELKNNGLYKAFAEVEMPCMQVLARMELTGFGFSQGECETQKAVMQAKLAALEEQAYRMAGHGFSLTSPADIAQVLYVELRLPPNGDPTLASTAALRKTLGARGGMPRLPKHFSTCKDSLEKLRPFHPLPGVVLEWRRITAAVTKVIFPLLKERKAEPNLGGDRIYSSCQTHTATGRVCLSDPNIQAIPRDFEIEMPSAIGESPPLGADVPTGLATGLAYPTRARTRQTQGRVQQGRGARMAQEGCQPGPSCAVSVRHAFCPFQGGVLLAADYSQLELRILAHLARDSKLAGILNGGGDVFKCIAAQWRQIDEGQVNPKQRQQAKQICYGMVYGIGAKALGQQLGEKEEDAAAFMESFKTQYKGMKTYIRDTVDRCRASGFVETILHRRRFLPAITHSNPATRSQAERQAVNTTIQGSAADLVKVAMVNIDRRLKEEFPNTTVTHRHRQDFETGSTQRRKSRRCTTTTTPSGAFLVLQLHDELIYEVHREDVVQVAQLVKVEMESAIKMSIKLPVKIKVGPTWGSLEDFDI